MPYPSSALEAVHRLSSHHRELVEASKLCGWTLYAKCKIENPVDRARSVVIPKLRGDTGSEYTWVSERTLERIGIRREKKDLAFVLANGQQVTRAVGFAIVRLDKFFTIDEVVFAEKGDLFLLGARTLDGLNLTIDPARKKLVAAGPLPAAPAGRASAERIGGRLKLARRTARRAPHSA
jgi:predicted aspartyl protease